MLLKRKRRSSPFVDENEDGGRAIVVEEGISALVFGHARHRNFFAGEVGVDNGLLTSIKETVEGLEVARASRSDWASTRSAPEYEAEPGLRSAPPANHTPRTTRSSVIFALTPTVLRAVVKPIRWLILIMWSLSALVPV